MRSRSVDDLIRAGKLEETAPDRATAEAELTDAKRHLRSAEKLVRDDPVMAYTALYDATRKAIGAHMRTRGLRVKGSRAHHARTFEYAEAALADLSIDEHLSKLDDMRVTRNDTEYRGGRVGEAEVRADLETAQRIVAAIETDF